MNPFFYLVAYEGEKEKLKGAIKANERLHASMLEKEAKLKSVCRENDMLRSEIEALSSKYNSLQANTKFSVFGCESTLLKESIEDRACKELEIMELRRANDDLAKDLKEALDKDLSTDVDVLREECNSLIKVITDRDETICRLKTKLKNIVDSFGELEKSILS